MLCVPLQYSKSFEATFSVYFDSLRKHPSLQGNSDNRFCNSMNLLQF